MAFSTGHKPVQSQLSNLLPLGEARDLPKPVRPKTASAVLRRRAGKTTEIVAARKTRARVNRWK